MSTMTVTSTSSERGSMAFHLMMRVTELYDSMAERIRQRRALMELSDEMLKDIGMNRADVYGECRKRFWQA